MKLLIALNLMNAVLFVSACSKTPPPKYYNKNEPSMGILVDKNTPVFYVTGQYYDVKVRKEINVFNDSTSISYYKNFANNQTLSGTLYPKILIAVDNGMYKQYNKSGILEAVLNYWNEVDAYYQKLTSLKVKLCIAGVMIMQDANAWEFLHPSATNYDSSPKLRVGSALTHLRYWIDDNRSAIDNLKFNMVYLMTSHNMYDGDQVYGQFKIADGYNDRVPFPGMVSKWDDFGGSVFAVRLIARTLGIEYESSSACENTYVMCDSWKTYTTGPDPWSADSKFQFMQLEQTKKLNYLSEKPSCLK
ncbi:uncharacterized protein LOC103573784 [Microplitis demolitor]|uniref:uncharacterized protein LOC103573784 n=1 Tax=Microplitis demolitor TaxID=69319 RepID=UPI0004CCD3E5|nr:uncharacterized protein LOC103573784 [Microplitis demolitor]